MLERVNIPEESKAESSQRKSYDLLRQNLIDQQRQSGDKTTLIPSSAENRRLTRMEAAEVLRQRSDLEAFKKNSAEAYKSRYGGTEINSYDGETYELETYVDTEGMEYPCYFNRLRYDEENQKWNFDSMSNYKSMPPETDRKLGNFSRTSGQYDKEIDKEGTQPLPHEQIVWNQINDFNIYIKQYKEDMHADLDVYKDCDILVTKDRKLVDTLLPDHTGSKTFVEGEAGYYSILEESVTGKAKANLGVLFEKKISSITVEKAAVVSPDEISYYITYSYEHFKAH